MSHRWTLDYPEDYEFIRRVYAELYPINPAFGLHDILALLERKPELMEINAEYIGVNWYRHHLDELKTITPAMTQVI
jgi:spore coat polysaccharide biosynthesis protein SpsF